ncbi:hypothetical protein [Microbulbifer epialgicus]|uniref:Uncharacterized protein n=1 Tax=Microbulbifer epialgicus TaxID=393907 RepID=A0ABV4NUN7_9GAMM
MSSIIALVQFLVVIGVIFLGMAMVGVTFQGQSQVTNDFASFGGYCFLLAFVIIAIVTISITMYQSCSSISNKDSEH